MILPVSWTHSANSYLYERRLIQMIRRVSKHALTYSYWLQRTCWTHDKISSKKLTNKNWQPILTIPKHQDTNIRYSLFHIDQGYYGGNSARDEVLRELTPSSAKSSEFFAKTKSDAARVSTSTYRFSHMLPIHSPTLLTFHPLHCELQRQAMHCTTSLIAVAFN